MRDIVQLNQLAKWDSRPDFTLSLYLALDQTRDGRLMALSQLIKSTELKMKGNGSFDIWRKMAPDLKQAIRYVEELPLGPDRGLILFSCLNKELFSAYSLPILVPNIMEVGPGCYIRPLAALTKDYRPTLIVVTDHNTARFFSGFMGDLKEIEEAKIITEPDIYQTDGSYARAGNARLARKADELKNRHAKDVNAKLMELGKDYGQVLLGGVKSAVDILIPSLHSYVQARFAGFFSCDVGANLTGLSKSVEQALAKARQERQDNLLNDLNEKLGPKGQTSLGLNQVLADLHDGRVHTLFARRGFTIEGGACPSCNRLRHVAGECPLCGDTMTHVDDVVNLACAQAIESGAELEQVQGPSKLDEFGGIAALLRYSL